MTKVGLDAIGTSTTLASNKSHVGSCGNCPLGYSNATALS